MTTADRLDLPNRADGRKVGEVPSFDVTLRIRRFNPEVDAEPHWEDYRRRPSMRTDRVLDALHKIKWEQDGIADLPPLLRARRLRLGRDAHQRPQPARLQDADQGPRPHASRSTSSRSRACRSRRTSSSTWSRSSQSYREVQPFLVTTGHEPTRERIQSPADRERFDDTTKCILCAACTSSCPVFWTDGQYFGPAAIVNAHRFIFDSRDEGAEVRLDILNDKEGVWRCRTTFNCTEACPRGIQVTKAIEEVKRALLARKI